MQFVQLSTSRSNTNRNTENIRVPNAQSPAYNPVSNFDKTAYGLVLAGFTPKQK